MASPQTENGYTAIANEILEAMARYPLNGTQARILFVVWRATYGFKKKSYELSINYLINAMSMNKSQYPQVKREIDKLIELNILIEEKKPTKNSSRVLMFNKNHELYSKKCSTLKSVENSTLISTETSTLKRVVKKKDKKKKEKKEASPLHKELIEYFCNKYQSSLGYKYNFVGGKDGKLISSLIKSHEPAFLFGLVNWYFDEADDFIKKVGWSIAGLYSNINKYIAQKKNNVSIYREM